MSEAELVRQCRKDEPKAWQELIRRFTPLVYRLSFRMLSNQHEAEDASQESFMRIHGSFSHFDPTRPLAPWISRVTYNVCLKRLKRTSRLPTLPLEPILEISGQGEKRDNPERAISKKEEKAFLMKALSRLSAQDRAILDLRYREGMSDAEVSEATGMPVNTIKTRIFRARSFLKKILTPLLKEAEKE